MNVDWVEAVLQGAHLITNHFDGKALFNSSTETTNVGIHSIQSIRKREPVCTALTVAMTHHYIGGDGMTNDIIFCEFGMMNEPSKGK